jgi:hypothetical protein
MRSTTCFETRTSAGSASPIERRCAPSDRQSLGPGAQSHPYANRWVSNTLRPVRRNVASLEPDDYLASLVNIRACQLAVALDGIELLAGASKGDHFVGHVQ